MQTFDQDLFISYAHIDNRTGLPDEEELGWIALFHKKLEAYVSQHWGNDVKIWRDGELTGNSDFSEEIIKQIAQSAVFISVLTPRYIKSEWCTRELAEFCKIARESGGISVDDKIRIFKVVKIPVRTLDSLPEEVSRALEYEFYKLKNGKPYPLDRSFGKDFEFEYNRKVNELAVDISELLEELTSLNRGNGQIEKKKKKQTVYLAECSYDRKQEREILRCELKRFGYEVLPKNTLPNDVDEEYVSVIEPLLESSDLSVHLIGKTGGPVPDGPRQKSLSILQNEVAVKYSKRVGLKRVIWVPEGTFSAQARQQAFIDALHNDPEAQFGADLITGNLEELKSVIHSELLQRELSKTSQSEAPGVITINPSKLIYLICDRKDLKNTIPLQKYCRNKGFEIEIPAFTGEAAAIRETHEKLLADCDFVILFYGAGDEAWKKSVSIDLRKISHFREGNPLPPKFTFVADPSTADKEILIETEPNLINGLGEFSDSIMEPFLRETK
ncbi:MAG: TIR domain-containing protein [Acidobacteriota bacterium]|nr:TIR domain-containing protein [Acidobacteriota bacterium]MDH3529684.1 TIR domain-containing protein [Acidobacteriota bacterium]